MTRVPLTQTGHVADQSTWRAKLVHTRADEKNSTTGNFYVNAMVAAGDHLFLAGHEKQKNDNALHVYSSKDGSKLTQWPLPDRPVRNGIAVARGHLLVSCEDGSVICLK